MLMISVIFMTITKMTQREINCFWHGIKITSLEFRYSV